MSVRIKELTYNNKCYTDKNQIENLLLKKSLYWIIDAEIENAILEIKGDKLFWYSGVWYFGNFEYGIWIDGIFKYGNFEGVWHNGIFKRGIFKGIWMNGVFEDGTFEGEWRNGKNHTIDNNFKK